MKSVVNTLKPFVCVSYMILSSRPSKFRSKILGLCNYLLNKLERSEQKEGTFYPYYYHRLGVPTTLISDSIICSYYQLWMTIDESDETIVFLLQPLFFITNNWWSKKREIRMETWLNVLYMLRPFSILYILVVLISNYIK